MRLEDDGCPNILPVLNHILPSDIKVGWWTNNSKQGYEKEDFKQHRIYCCERCGWYVWHPISYCHKCGGAMVKLKGTSKRLQEMMNEYNYQDGGF